LHAILMRHLPIRLRAAHDAAFALPEVERATDLLPELVGLIGQFLSENSRPSDYVSIHALPKPKPQWWQEEEGESAEEKDEADDSASAVASAPSPPPPDKA
jgi:hypothetical protein